MRSPSCSTSLLPSGPSRSSGCSTISSSECLPFLGRFDHPRFFAYIPGAGTWPAALADLVASAANIDAGEWREAVGPSQVELIVLRWFADWIGYPSGADGILVSGGSAANLQALAVAREALVGPMSDRIVVYVGDVAHSSVARGARALGFRPEQVRVLQTDERFRLRADTVAARWTPIAGRGGCRSRSLRPAARRTPVPSTRSWSSPSSAENATSGCMSTRRTAGSPSSPNADDSSSTGWSFADSVTLDPHKWLDMPFEVGCLMVREGHQLRSAFEIVPEYLKDTQMVGGRGEPREPRPPADPWCARA